MADSSILDIFATHPFLYRLDEQHRMRLAAGARPFTAAAGEYLFHEGDPANAFYLVQDGFVAITATTPDQGEVVIQTVGPGEVVGWSWLLPPYRWQFGARAAGPVRGISFDGEWLRTLCEQDYELGYHLLKELLAVVGGRLAATRRQRFRAAE